MRPASAFLLLFLALAPALAAAQAPMSPYSVAVPVDATAENAAKARDVAIADGQVRALAVLLRRLTPASAEVRLPKVSSAEAARLVQSFGVADERSSATRYLARLTVDFRRDAVRRLLRDAGVPYADTQARPALLLPVLERPGGRLLYEPDNPWRQAWALSQQSGRLYPVLLPLAGQEGVQTVKAADAAAGDAGALAALGRLYDAETVLLAIGKLALDMDRGGTPRLDVTLSRHGASAGPTIVQGYAAGGSETAEDLLRRAAGDLADQLDEQWAQDTALNFDSEQSLSVRVPLEDLATWVAVRGRLARVGMVATASPERITRRDLQLLLGFYGTPQQLALALAQSGLELSEDAGYWQLRLRDRSAP